MKKKKRQLSGVAIAALGLVLLLQELGVISVDLVRYWPALIVVLGVWMALG